MRSWPSKFIVGAALLALSMSSKVNAQEYNWTNATGNNSWNTEANWNFGEDGIPLGGDININGGVGLCILTSDSFITPSTLDLGPGAALDMQSGEFIFGPNGVQNPYSIQNSGEINVLQDSILGLRENNRNFSPATINVIDGGILKVHANGASINTSTQNTGNGSINMSSFTGPSSKITGASGASLSFQKQTIQGFGDIGENNLGLTLDFSSIIDSNFDGQEMNIDVHNASGIINQGIMKASNGGVLRFTGSTTIDNTGGLIEAMTGSEVFFDTGFNIAGGILQQTGTGAFDMFGSGSLADLTLDGVYIEVPNSGSLNLDGEIINNGLIETNSTTTISDIRVDDSATLTGGGTIRLGGTINNSRFLDVSVGNGVLTNVDNTIEGHGSIGVGLLHVINQAAGVIDANDTSGDQLVLDPTNANPMINRGLFTASSGGRLALTGGEFDNANGLIEAQDDSSIEIRSTARVVGGTIRNVGTGTILPSSGIIEDVTIEGTINVQNSKILNLAGTINNLGEIVTDSTTTISDVRVDHAATLTGGGTVTLGGTVALSRLLDVSVGNGVLTNVDNTIQGKGAIGVSLMRLINEQDGTIVGSDPTGSLVLDPPNAGPMINRGLYTSTAGGDLLLSTGDFENSDGMIRAGSMSTITITNGADVTGGQLVAEDDSTIRFGGTAVIADVVLQAIGSGEYESISGAPTLADSTNDSTITVNNSAAMGLDGAIINNGLIETNSTTTISDIRVDDSATLTGGGTIRLGGTSTGSRLLDVNVGGAILTNVDNTIEGRGSIGVNLLSVINQADGVIDANDTTGTGQLVLDPANANPMVNRGLYTASSGGKLFLTGGQYDNANGLIEPQDDSFIEISSSARVVGGTFRNFGTGTFVPSSGIIEDATIEGTFNVQNSKILNLEGTIINLGEIVTDSTTTISDIRVDHAVTLTGGGTVTLGGTTALSRLLDVSVGDGVLTNVDNTIQGKGAVGANLMQLINQVDGIIHANVAGTLTVDMPTSNPTFANEGTLKASNGGTLNFVNTLENGVQGIMSGDSIIASNQTILNMGTIAPGNSAGTLTINADLTMEATSIFEVELENLNMVDLLDVNGDVALGGELKVNFLSGYTPSPTDEFDILIADSLTGTFSNAADGAQMETADGKGIVTVNYVGGTVRLSNFIAFTMGQTVSVTRGSLASGSEAELELSDNADISIRRSNTDVISRTEFELTGVSPLAAPASMTVVLEGSVFARTNVAQRIELYNYATDAWEIVDSRFATRFVDSTATVTIKGDLSRFVEQSTLEIAARVRFTSGNRRQRFTSNTDQFIWIIQ